MRNFLRILFTVALVYGYVKLEFSPHVGPWTEAFRIVLCMGGLVGLICLEVTNFFRKKKQKESRFGEVVDSAATSYFQKKKDPELGLPADPSLAAEPLQLTTAQPTWMGDPTGNRRRLVIILIGLAVVGCAATLFFIFGR